MQTISRRSGESIYIGDHIRVAVVFEDGNITLGVQAPESFAVVKAEHYNAPEDKPVSLFYRLKMFLSLRDQRSA